MKVNHGCWVSSLTTEEKIEHYKIMLTWWRSVRDNAKNLENVSEANKAIGTYESKLSKLEKL